MKKEKLVSFLGDPKIKAKKIADMKKHHKLDNLRQGAYFNAESEKGCAVTCTMFTPEDFKKGYLFTADIHSRYETELGIPRIIARLEDRIFEGLTVTESRQWTIDFLEAIPVCVNLEPVWRKFMIWLLIDPSEGVIRYAKTKERKKAINDVAKAFTNSLTKNVKIETWRKLRAAAYAAYADAAAAYAAAAYADAADAAYAAAADAYAAAYAAAAAAADAAADAAAADADAYAAAAAAAAAADADAYAAAYAADAADAAARSRKYTVMAAKLIELLKEAK